MTKRHIIIGGGSGFIGDVLAIALNARGTLRVRHVQSRIGILRRKIERKSGIGRLWRIGRARGFLPLIRLPFCVSLGATIGTGRQILPWVHIDDMVGVLLHVLDNPETQGRYNAVSTGIVGNTTFATAFAKVLGRQIVWSLPEGFEFIFTTIDSAAQGLVKKAI